MMQIDKIDDLIRILEEHPEWRDRLRGLLFTDEEKQVPDRLDRMEGVLERLVESHERAIDRLDRLEASLEKLWQSHQQALERLDRLEASLEKLWQSHQQALERLDRLEASVEELWESHRHLEQQVQQLTEQVRQLTVVVEDLVRWSRKADDDLARLKGGVMELQFARRASAILGYYVRRPRVVDVALTLDDLIDSGAEFTDQERKEVLSIDELVSAKHPRTGEPIHIAVEVSWMIFPDDVERIARRAALLTARGLTAFPAVAGEGITPDARDLAQREKVLVILDGAIDFSDLPWVRSS